MKHYLTKDEDDRLFHEFYNDPTTDDMSWNEYLRWQGWTYEPSTNRWYKII